MPNEALPAPSEQFVADTNADGLVNVADVSGWALQAFFWPGDGLLWALSRYAPPLARFLEIDASDYGGFGSGMISACAWLLGLVALGVAWVYVTDLDRRVTRALAVGYSATLRRLRIGVRQIRSRLSRSAAEPLRSIEVDFDEYADLGAVELKALRLLADLGPGFALTVSDVAARLGERIRATQDLLEALQRRKLLNRALGGTEGETSYTLTAAGRAILLLKQLEPRSSLPSSRLPT